MSWSSKMSKFIEYDFIIPAVAIATTLVCLAWLALVVTVIMIGG